MSSILSRTCPEEIYSSANRNLTAIRRRDLLGGLIHEHDAVAA
jgi:hypothetical protein